MILIISFICNLNDSDVLCLGLEVSFEALIGLGVAQNSSSET